MESDTTLYTHTPHTHTARNVNEQHHDEQAQQGINTTIAVWLTQHVGTMTCAYLFAVIGVGSLVGAVTGNTFLAVTFGALSSYFLQLVLLPILSVGQNVLGRKQELLAEEQYQTTLKSEHNIEGVLAHLDAQDAELLRQTATLESLLAATQNTQANPITAQIDELTALITNERDATIALLVQMLGKLDTKRPAPKNRTEVTP